MVDLATPDELPTEGIDATERSAQRIYQLYASELKRRDGWDFDDLIFRSVRYLRAEQAARQRWQDRWWCVLVDEYQDIEPAQEQLVQMLAAPHDCLFVVGDEDQCIYAWRRARVERIVELDKQFPTLERVVLGTNYRCGSAIVAAADQLIRHNRVRFSKSVRAGRTDTGTIAVHEYPDSVAEAADTVRWLAEHSTPGDVAVLARTAGRLREIAMACVDAGVAITASERVLRPSRAESVLLACLKLCHRPNDATPADVLDTFRYPNRYLPSEMATRLLQSRRSEHSFVAGMARLPAMEEWRSRSLATVAPLLDELTGIQDAARAVAFMRRDLGLDSHFASRDQLSPTDNDDRDALDAIADLARKMSTSQLIDTLMSRRERLEQLKSGDGVQLMTIHGAKGGEWPAVALVGANLEAMPHQRALADVAEDAEKTRQVWEDERRLAYVAFTRAKDHLRISWSGTASSFLHEAGILSAAATGPASLQTSAQGQSPPSVTRPATTQRTARRRSTFAKYSGTCRACSRPIAVGAAIKHDGRVWVHDACA